jgi:uncharacterized membrane protein
MSDHPQPSGVGHGHSHDDDRPLDERLRALASRRVLLGAVVAIVVLTVAGLIVLWPGHVKPVTNIEGEDFFGERVEADVGSVTTDDCSYSSTPGEFTCDTVEFAVTSGTPAGERDALELPYGLAGPQIRSGDRIVLYYTASAPDGAHYQFADFQRSSPMLVLVALFVAVVVVFGRWRGLFAIAGVGVSMVVLVGFVLPALLNGEAPIWVALVGTSAVALPALYLAHGLSERTSVAVLGTVASLLLTCLLGVVFVDLTHLTGLASEEVGFLQAFGGQLDFAGLLLAGMVIGALGVLDDVTVTQVAAVWELHEAKPHSTARQLYDAGVRIGRDHIASTVNTLVLAYAGASLPLLLVFKTAGQRFGDVITGEAIAVEIVRALVGSIGLVASVPITTGLAALVATRADSDRVSETEPAASWEDFGPVPD